MWPYHRSFGFKLCPWSVQSNEMSLPLQLISKISVDSRFLPDILFDKGAGSSLHQQLLLQTLQLDLLCTVITPARPFHWHFNGMLKCPSHHHGNRVSASCTCMTTLPQHNGITPLASWARQKSSIISQLCRDMPEHMYHGHSDITHVQYI